MTFLVESISPISACLICTALNEHYLSLAAFKKQAKKNRKILEIPSVGFNPLDLFPLQRFDPKCAVTHTTTSIKAYS